MTALDPRALLDELEKLRAEPERVCQWCMARPGEWCESDCANPERQCHPSYVAEFAAKRGAYSDHDAALIVAAVNRLPALTAAIRAALDLADELDGEKDGYGYRIRNGLDPSPGDRLRSTVAAALEGR